MKQMLTCNLLISSALLTIGYSGNLIAVDNQDDLSLSVEFLEYLVDMECDPAFECIELSGIQDQTNNSLDATSQTESDTWVNEEGQDED